MVLSGWSFVELFGGLRKASQAGIEKEATWAEKVEDRSDLTENS